MFHRKLKDKNKVKPISPKEEAMEAYLLWKYSLPNDPTDSTLFHTTMLFYGDLVRAISRASANGYHEFDDIFFELSPTTLSHKMEIIIAKHDVYETAKSTFYDSYVAFTYENGMKFYPKEDWKQIMLGKLLDANISPYLKPNDIKEIHHKLIIEAFEDCKKIREKKTMCGPKTTVENWRQAARIR